MRISLVISFFFLFLFTRHHQNIREERAVNRAEIRIALDSAAVIAADKIVVRITDYAADKDPGVSYMFFYEFSHNNLFVFEI